MNQKKPFIHLLKSPYHEYIYDANTNEIICISADLYRYLWIWINQPEKLDLPKPSVTEELNRLKESGYLKCDRPEKIENPQIDNIENILENGLTKLTLQVTQTCNFRCSYCDYSNDIVLRNRTHSYKNMTWETAKKAIDFFACHIRDSNEVNIGFYGGEPLLEFDLIRQCIEYIEDVLEGKAYSFTMTTNGYILSLDIARYLYEKGVDLVISLDGPKDIHDSNRKFAADGSGTYDVIMQNLNYIRDYLPEYYDKLMFNSVIDPLNDYQCTKDYFCGQHSARNITTPLMTPQSGTKQVFSEEFIKAYKNEQLLGFLYLQGVVNHNEIGPLAANFASSIQSSINTKFTKRIKIPSRIGHSGPCIPGAMRLFIDTEGNLFPCERVSESSSVMNIGHIDIGFNIDKAIALLNISQLTETYCKNCWAITHCKMCAKDADDTNQLSVTQITPKCKSTRDDIEKEMLNYIAIYETKEILSKR